MKTNESSIEISLSLFFNRDMGDLNNLLASGISYRY
jgi:hypothetical protein